MAEELEKRREILESSRINLLEDLFEVESILFLFEEGETDLVQEMREKLFHKRLARVRRDIEGHVDGLFTAAVDLMEQLKIERGTTAL